MAIFSDKLSTEASTRAPQAVSAEITICATLERHRVRAQLSPSSRAFSACASAKAFGITVSWSRRGSGI